MRHYTDHSPVGYTGDAAVYCPPCAIARYGEGIAVRDIPDGEGNPVRPLFRWDEIPADWACDSCHDPIA